jgi:glycosyltransferase involved in cell wall biosynthesis
MLFSVVIPVYNEEKIVESAVNDLISKMTTRFSQIKWEILLVENGSSDSTALLVDNLAKKFQQVRALHHTAPDYGAALKMGILNSKGDFVVGDEIDLGDVEFFSKSLNLLVKGDADMVVGSKTLPGAGDERPLMRKTATRVMNLLLKLLLGFSGSDTHGLKMFSRKKLLPIVESCVISKDLFASELIIRCERENFKIIEIPIALKEKRPPAINLFKRVPGVFKGLWKLRMVLGPKK